MYRALAGGRRNRETHTCVCESRVCTTTRGPGGGRRGYLWGRGAGETPPPTLRSPGFSSVTTSCLHKMQGTEMKVRPRRGPPGRGPLPPRRSGGLRAGGCPAHLLTICPAGSVCAPLLLWAGATAGEERRRRQPGGPAHAGGGGGTGGPRPAPPRPRAARASRWQCGKPSKPAAHASHRSPVKLRRQ